MDASVSKEFLKVYDQIQKLQEDITEVAKDCYNTSEESYEDSMYVPEKLSELENDAQFITREQSKELAEESSNSCLKLTDKQKTKKQVCTITTEFEDLLAKTQDSDDYSKSVATTQFVHNVIHDQNENVKSYIIAKLDTNDFVTSDQLHKAINDSISENDEADKNIIDQKVHDAVQQLSGEIQGIVVPTKVSQLTNDSGYITANQVPEDLVKSVNGKQGDVVLNIPVIPTEISAFVNDAGYITDAGVTSVNNRTGIVTVQENVQSDWQATSGLAKILNKPTLRRVATTGDYNDLDNLPNIPTVYDWATQQNKPSYTAQEVGALSDNTLYAGSAVSGGAANKAVSIPFGQVDSTSTADAFTATVDGVVELRDGVCCYIRNGVVTSASGCTLDVNGLGAKPMYSSMATATEITTVFNAAYTMLFVYNSSRVEGGCWDMYYGYNSNTDTLGYELRTNNTALPLSKRCYRYRLLFTSADGTHFVPSNSSTYTNNTSARPVIGDKIDPFGRITYYYRTTVLSAEDAPHTSYLYDQHVVSLGYSFNRTGSALQLTFPAPVYIKCQPQQDGSAIIDSNTPYVQQLPNSEDGNIYIYLGIAYSATAVELYPNHPVYYYKDGAIRLWTGTDVDYNQFQRKPVTIWETNETGLLSSDQDIKENMTWQLTGLNMTPYKRVKIYTKAGKKASGVDIDASNTPAVVLEMSLDNRAAGPTGGHFIGSIVGQKPNDANRLFTVTCAISADKTSFAVLRMSTLYDTAATANSDCNGYVFKIEGYYD